jgi:bifunctional DNase/RNase
MNGKYLRKPPWGNKKIIPVEVMGISVCPPYQGYVVILQESEGERRLPIFIGVAEAQAISILLQKLEYARPLTFDLFGNVLEAMGAKVISITVTELRENTFYATVEILDKEGEVYYVDARPSDSIALALKTKAAIFVVDKVMDSAALQPDQMPESEMDKITALNQKLQEAVADEAYEEAAKIRDKIKELEKKLGGEKKSSI